jgi:hypothetical protein
MTRVLFDFEKYMVLIFRDKSETHILYLTSSYHSRSIYFKTKLTLGVATLHYFLVI